MSDDDPTTVRDLRIMGRGMVVAAGCAALVVGSIIAGVVYLVNLSNEVESHGRWIAKQEKKTEDDARSERWRRDREQRGMATPPAVPRSGM